MGKYMDSLMIRAVRFCGLLVGATLPFISHGSVLMDSDMPGQYYPREMLAKGIFSCRVIDDVFMGFDRDEVVIERSHKGVVGEDLKIDYEIAKKPAQLHFRPEDKHRITKYVFVDGPFLTSYWSDQDFDTADVGKMALRFNDDEFTLGYGYYEEGLFLQLHRVYKEDWMGYVVNPLGEAITAVGVSCKQRIVVER